MVSLSTFAWFRCPSRNRPETISGSSKRNRAETAVELRETKAKLSAKLTRETVETASLEESRMVPASTARGADTAWRLRLAVPRSRTRQGARAHA